MDSIVYHDKKYILGCENGEAYLAVGGKRYRLTCSPYEPCLYITDENGSMTAVHNAFKPLDVLELFESGSPVTSITGLEYNAEDFCAMVDYAAGRGDISIDEAEKVFRNRPKNNSVEEKLQTAYEFNNCPDDDFYRLIAEYPDCVVDYCIVRDDPSFKGYTAHWRALVFACNKLFTDGDEVVWHYDLGKADGREIAVEALFAPADMDGKLNYRKAFLRPPYENNYTDSDFDRVNAALFPNGTRELEVYEWTSNWSEYFDEGNEWWGSLCLTVYDRSLGRFVVILASATD